MTVSQTPDLDEVFGKKEIPTIDEIKARVVPTQFPRHSTAAASSSAVASPGTASGNAVAA